MVDGRTHEVMSYSNTEELITAYPRTFSFDEAVKYQRERDKKHTGYYQPISWLRNGKRVYIG